MVVVVMVAIMEIAVTLVVQMVVVLIQTIAVNNKYKEITPIKIY